MSYEPSPSSTSRTLGDLRDLYTASTDFRLLAPSTKRNTNWALKKLKALEGDDLDAIEPASLLPIISGLGPGAQAIFISRTKSLFGFGVKYKLMKGNPAATLKAPPPGEFRPWKQAEVDVMLAKASPKVKTAIMLAYYTGQRISDVLSMRWDDIHDGDLHVIQQKTKTPLRIPLHPILKGWLRSYRVKNPGTYIICNAKGGKMETDTFRAMFVRERKRLSLPKDMAFHGLRKLTACRLAERGASTKEIMAVGGWKSLKQVEHYCKGANQRELAARAMGKLGAL